MRSFAQAREIFKGSQAAGQSQHHVDRYKPSQLQPGKRGAIDAEPHRLPHNDIGFGRFVTGKASMQEIDDRQHRTGERHQGENKKTPARPDVGKCLCDQEVQSAPTKDHQEEGRKGKWFESELVVHRGNYTRRDILVNP